MIKRRITILAAADMPQDSAGWICAWCKKGICHAPQNQLRQTPRAYLMRRAKSWDFEGPWTAGIL